MRLMITVSLVAAVFASPLCFGQSVAGPSTFDNLIGADVKSLQQPDPGGGAEAAPWRLEGAVTRPESGVAGEPDIDAAWEAYVAQVEAAAKDIEELIEREVDGFAAEGNLDGAKAWKAAGEQFAAEGRMPKGLANRKPAASPRGGRPEPSAAEVINKLQDRLADAADQLFKVYESAEKALTKKHDFDKATTVREERWGLLQDSRVLRKSTASVDQIVGKWRWNVGGRPRGEFDFRVDGTMKESQSGPRGGRWELTNQKNRNYTLTWQAGAVDYMTLSDDGATLIGKNHGGVSIRGERVE